jgi:hypothetical protein
MFVLNNLLPAQRTGAVHPKHVTRGLNTTRVKNRSVCQEENGRVTYCIALVGWFYVGYNSLEQDWATGGRILFVGPHMTECDGMNVLWLVWLGNTLLKPQQV